MEMGERFLYGSLGSAQVVGARRNQNVDHPLDIIVIGLGRMMFIDESGNVAQQNRRPR